MRPPRLLTAMLRVFGNLALSPLLVAASIVVAGAMAACGATKPASSAAAPAGSPDGPQVGGAAAEDGALCVAYADRNGVEALLVRTSSVDPVEFYSQARENGATKLLEDVVMDELERYLLGAGFREHGSDGPAPRPGGGVSSVIELRYSDRIRHFAYHSGASKAAAAAYLDCLSNFMVLYSEVKGYQTVQNARGEALFDAERARLDQGRP